MKSFSITEFESILSPDTIRAKAEMILHASLKGRTHFIVRTEKLEPLAKRVAQVTRELYPTLEIPYHSRFNHFRSGGHDRLKRFRESVAGIEPRERLKAEVDLVVVSVLLDAGAGMAWKYHDADTKWTGGKSEGLAIASLRLFEQGAFSSDASRPMSADVDGLVAFTDERLAQGFQVSASNPLEGLSGRASLIRNLGIAMKNLQCGRPGDLVQFIPIKGKAVEAVRILRGIQECYGEIWPSRIRAMVEGQERNLGDVWEYENHELIPFHKLSQWLAYSLFEAFERAGYAILDADRLTGLPEYRNGGLFVDGEVLELRNPDILRLNSRGFEPSHPLIVEWRALTIALLDRIAPFVREELKMDASSFPLAKVLEGGTWWTGRRLAAEKRSDGGSPIPILSDGTVF